MNKTTKLNYIVGTITNIIPMVLNKGGKKTKRVKRSAYTSNTKEIPTVDRSANQIYAFATKMLGNRRLTADCSDGKERLVIIPGKFKGRRNWIEPGMLLLLNLREYEEGKADVIYIYNNNESNKLERKGELSGFMNTDGTERVTMKGFEFTSEKPDKISDSSDSEELQQKYVFDLPPESSEDSEVDLDEL